MNEEALNQKTVSGKQNLFQRGSYNVGNELAGSVGRIYDAMRCAYLRMMKFEIFSKARCATENWHGLDSEPFIGTVATGNLAATQTAIS